MNRNPLRIGIIGIGGYGRHLLEGFLEQRSFALEIVSAVVVDPEEDRTHLAFLKSRCPQVEVYDSCEALFAAAPPLDLLLLPVSIHAHKPLTLRAIEAGWNVLLEKPLAGSVADALTICEAQEKADTFVAVGYQDMYGETVFDILRAIASGAIGDVERLSSFAIWGRPREYYRRNSWAGRLYAGQAPIFDSPFNNGLAHFLNMALVFAGDTQGNPVRPIGAQAALFRGHSIESCDTATIRWTTDSGVQVDIYFSHLTCNNIGPEVKIYGRCGAILWKGEESWELCRTGEPSVRYSVQKTPQLRSAMIHRVLARAAGGDLKVFSPYQALAHVRAVELAHANTEIVNLPSNLLLTKGSWLDVENLEETLRTAQAENRLLSLNELSVPVETATS